MHSTKLSILPSFNILFFLYFILPSFNILYIIFKYFIKNTKLHNLYAMADLFTFYKFL